MANQGIAHTVSELRQEFVLSRLIPASTAGVLVGLINIVYAISFVALAYGSLPTMIPRAIGLSLAGLAILQAIVVLTSSNAGTIATLQDVPTAILGLVTVYIISDFPAGTAPEILFITVTAAVMISTFATGLFFLLLGYFKLGNLVRFLPYPVIGGFLAGTGWLLVIGGINVMTSLPIDLANLPTLLTPDYLLKWVLGLTFALLLFFILKRFTHYTIFPLTLLITIVTFYIFLWLAGIPIQQMMDQSWLMGPFPENNSLQPLSLNNLAQVEWSVVFRHSSNLLTILPISMISLLLHATSLELIIEKNLNLNHELKVAGWANMAISGIGSMQGFHGAVSSSLLYKIAGFTRMGGLVSAVFICIVMLYGTEAIAITPRFVIGGILTYLGFGLLEEWLYQAWYKFSRFDYLIIVTILIVIATIGFLEGVLLGTILALILFVVNYSRIDVVKHSLSGANYQSRVTRPPSQRQFLDAEGEALFILELQGFIFFGTANNLFEQFNERILMTDIPTLKYILLDFRQVTGVDSTALLGFTKIKQLVQKQGIVLVFTDLSAGMRHKFEQGGIKDEGGTVRFLPDLDHGLEWCENQLLIAADMPLYQDHENLIAQLTEILPASANLEHLINYFDRLEVDEGYYLMHQGDRPDALYFVESGRITAQLEYPDREPLRLETMRGGRVVGEIGFYLSTDRTAAVVADAPSVIYRFSLDTLEEIEKSDPAAASTFHKLIVHLLSHRLTHLITTVRALQR